MDGAPPAGHGYAQVCTLNPDGSGVAWLGRIGHVNGLSWTDTVPGGNEQLQATLQIDPRYRTTALNPGRLVRAYKGGSVQFEGILDEPVPGSSGFQLTAAGAGTWGGRYQAIYSTWTATDILTQAISRGLRWVLGSIGSGYLAQQYDSGSQTVQDFLTGYTSPGSATWRVHRTFAGNQIDIYPLPATPTRILIATVPAARTLAGYYNAIWIRYQNNAPAAGSNTSPTFAVTSVTNAASIAKHGRQETYWDLSSAGFLTTAAAQAYGNNALAKYQAASWAGPFQVAPGQYRTMGGAPVDLGTEHAGEVARLVLADGPYGGEVNPAPPVQFLVGKYEYHDTDGSAVVTPYQYWASDLSGMIQSLTPISTP
jgi:hypothetical protein